MNRSDSANPFDPFGAWAGMRDTMMESWSKAMIDFVNSDAYAQATGTLLDNYLTMSVPFQKSLEAAMTRILAQLNMPSRTEMTSLAERLTNIEMRLDDLDARLDAIQGSLVDRPASQKRPSGSGGT